MAEPLPEPSRFPPWCLRGLRAGLSPTCDHELGVRAAVSSHPCTCPFAHSCALVCSASRANAFLSAGSLWLQGAQHGGGQGADSWVLGRRTHRGVAAGGGQSHAQCSSSPAPYPRREVRLSSRAWHLSPRTLEKGPCSQGFPAWSGRVVGACGSPQPLSRLVAPLKCGLPQQRSQCRAGTGSRPSSGFQLSPPSRVTWIGLTLPSLRVTTCMAYCQAGAPLGLGAWGCRWGSVLLARMISRGVTSVCSSPRSSADPVWPRASALDHSVDMDHLRWPEALGIH